MLGASCSPCCSPTFSCATTPPDVVRVTLSGGSSEPSYKSEGGANFFYVARNNLVVTHNFAGTYELTKRITTYPSEAYGGYELDVYIYQDTNVSLVFGMYPGGSTPTTFVNWWLAVNFLRWRMVLDWNVGTFGAAEIPAAISMGTMLSDNWKVGHSEGFPNVVQTNAYPQYYLGAGTGWASNDIHTSIESDLDGENLVLNGLNAYGFPYVDNQFYRQLIVFQGCPDTRGLFTSQLYNDVPFTASSFVRLDQNLYGNNSSALGIEAGASMTQPSAYSCTFAFPKSFSGQAAGTVPDPQLTVSGVIAIDKIEMDIPSEGGGVRVRSVPYE
jgi:hypothetical protein